MPEYGKPTQNIAPDQNLVARVGIDLSSVNSNQVQVPENAAGLSVIWMAGGVGTTGGQAVIYMGEASGFPWARMSAPPTTMTIANGPLAPQWQRGAYLTIVPSGNPSGFLVFEFFIQPPARSYSSI
jgi:hypothetical protein